VRELCLNVAKHARASLVTVALVEDGGCVRIDVTDDGSGFVANRSRKAGDGMGFGLFSIREQLRHYGGTLAIDPLPGKGTRVTLRMPVASPPEA
jgi:signal transduction histidine kinase